MTDVTKPEETKPSSPELLAQEEAAAKQQDAQRRAQMAADLAQGRQALMLTCLNLAHLATRFLPNPSQDNGTPKSKRNRQNRTLTLADLDKVSLVVERLTAAAQHLSEQSQGFGPMGMMRSR